MLTRSGRCFDCSAIQWPHHAGFLHPTMLFHHLNSCAAVSRNPKSWRIQSVKKLLSATFTLILILSMVTAATAAPKDIVDTAVAAGDFKTLVAALQAAGLVDTLKGAGPFTVFAPTDAAFAKLPAGTVQELLKPENKEKLVKILTYHVVAGEVTAKQVVKLTEAKTLEGQDVQISVHDGKVMINNATVVKADIKCSNGVIHVIDSVLLPK